MGKSPHKHSLVRFRLLPSEKSVSMKILPNCLPPCIKPLDALSHSATEEGKMPKAKFDRDSIHQTCPYRQVFLCFDIL